MNRGAYRRLPVGTRQRRRVSALRQAFLRRSHVIHDGLFAFLRYGAHSDNFMPQTLTQLAGKIGATVIGDGSTSVNGCATIDSAGPSDLTFLANSKYLSSLQTTKAAAVVIDGKTACPDRLVRLIAEDPYFAFRNALIELHGHRTHPQPMDSATKSPAANQACISPAASVHQTAKIGAGTIVHPNVTIESGATIGRNSVLYPGVYVGQNAVVGDECLLYPNVVIYDRCVLG